MAGKPSNINKASDPSEDDEFYKDGISLWSGKGLRWKTEWPQVDIWD